MVASAECLIFGLSCMLCAGELLGSLLGGKIVRFEGGKQYDALLVERVLDLSWLGLGNIRFKYMPLRIRPRASQ
jgi:hypothetical protein